MGAIGRMYAEAEVARLRVLTGGDTDVAEWGTERGPAGIAAVVG